MRKSLFLPSFSFLFLLLSTSVQADVEYDSTRFVSGWGWLTYGRIESSHIREDVTALPYDYNKEELADLHAGFTLARSMGPKTRLVFQFGMMMSTPVIENSTQRIASQEKKFTPYIMQASLTSHLLSIGPAEVSAKYGYFSIKTNPDAQNLGEYFIRSWTYPTVLLSGFEVADKVKMMGLELQLNLFEKLDQDFIIILETERHPKEDFDLAYAINYSPIKLIEAGAGIYWDHAFLTNEELVEPARDAELYNNAVPNNIPRIMYIDTLTNDTINATFAGTKVMARAALDPKWFFASGIFGENDLKFYGEIAVLGWKNYPQWFENRMDRMPVMFGFNIPAFKFLDVLALEWEWCRNPWINSLYNVNENRTPVPYTGVSVQHLGNPILDGFKNIHRDDWKWSLYGSRKVNKYLKISAQIASDHSPRTLGEHEDITRVTFVEKPSDKWYWPFQDWYWTVRTLVYF